MYQVENSIMYNTNRSYVWHTIELTIEENPVYYRIAIKPLFQNVDVEYWIMETNEFSHLHWSFDQLIYFYLRLIFLLVQMRIHLVRMAARLRTELVK